MVPQLNPDSKNHGKAKWVDFSSQLSFHPQNPACLLSGGVDGLLNLFDINVIDEDDALLQTINHGSSIHHAGFVNETELFALSHDESFSIYSFSESTNSLPTSTTTTVFGDLRPALNCEYIADVCISGPSKVIVSAASQKYAATLSTP